MLPCKQNKDIKISLYMYAGLLKGNGEEGIELVVVTTIKLVTIAAL